MTSLLNSVKDIFIKPTKNELLKRKTGLNQFERKLLNDWLSAMHINPNKLTLEQKIAYSKYPVFRMMIQDYRTMQKARKTFKSRVMKFLKYKLPKLLFVCALIAVAYYLYK